MVVLFYKGSTTRVSAIFMEGQTATNTIAAFRVLPLSSQSIVYASCPPIYDFQTLPVTQKNEFRVAVKLG